MISIPADYLILMIIDDYFFSALSKSLSQKSQRGIPLTLSIENVDKSFENEMVKAVDGGM